MDRKLSRNFSLKLIIISIYFLHNRTDKHGLNRTIQQDGKHHYWRVTGRRRPEKLPDDNGDLWLRSCQEPVCPIGDSHFSQQVIGRTNGEGKLSRVTSSG